MILTINYIDGCKFVMPGTIESLCEHIKIQCKCNPEAIKSIRIVFESKNKNIQKG